MNLGNGFPVPQESGSIHPSDHWMILRNAEKPVTRNIIGGVNPNADPRVLRNEGVIYIGDPRAPMTEERPVMQTSIPAADEMQRSMVNHYGMLGLQGRISAERPVVQANYPMPDEVDVGSWRDLLIFGSEVSQVTPTDEALHEFDHDVSVNGGYYQNLMKGVHGPSSTTVPATDRLSLASSYRATGNECMEFQSANSILPEQMQALSAAQGIITSNLLPKTAIDGTPIQQKDACNLNSPPGLESVIDSCAANRFEFAPETPDQEKQLINHQLSDSQSFSAEESLPPKINEGIICTSSQGENPLDVLLGNAAELPASNSTALKEQNEGDRGGGIDLNKIPVQSAPRRRKHRPKVVVEGKKKKAPKPPVKEKPKRAPKTKNPDEKTPGKRKYVRRKGTETSVSKPGKESSGAETSAPNSASKWVRRGLNFELEARIDDESDKRIVADQQHPNLRPFDLNLESHDTEWSKEFDGLPDISAAMQRPQIACGAVQQGKSVLNLDGDNKKFCETLSPPSHTVSTATVTDHNFNVLARSLQTASIGDKNGQFCLNQGHQPLNGEGKGKVPAQANFSFSDVGVAQPLLVQTSTTVLKDVAAGKEKEGPKRTHWQTSKRANRHPADLMPSQVFQNEILRTAEQDCGDRTGIAASGSNKRKKFDNTCHGLAYHMPSYVASVEDSSRPLALEGSKMSHSSSSSSCTYGRVPNFNHGMQSTLRNNNSVSNGFLADRGTFTATLGNSYEDPQNLTWLQYHRLAMLKNYLQGAEALNLNVTTGSQGVPALIQGNGIVTPVDLSLKSRTAKPASIIQPSSQKLHLNDHWKQLVCQNSSKKAKEPKPRQNYAVSDTINEIISRLEGLAISDKRQNALVPYKGDGKVVPYVGFDPIKRSKPRPRVDLDPETNRLWNLLMGKTASESEETMDSDKEKWWEDERKLVHGRVNAFITLMHQVQGDRRFSPWKGSVLDSVIGVFLTQNVSDHLSSSAFISMVAKFPAPLRKPRRTCSEYESISWVEEPDVQIIDQDGTITYHGRKVMQPHKKQSSMTLNGSSDEGRAELLNWGTVTHCANGNNSGREEDVISSQNSSESFCQLAKYMRSSPESEVEDHVTVLNSKKNNIFEGAQKTEEFTSLQQFHSQMMMGMLNDKSSMSGYEQPKYPASASILCSGSNEHSYPVNSDFCSLQGSSFSSGCFCLNKTSDTGVNGSCCSALSEHSFFSTSAEIKKSCDAALTSNMKGGATRSASYSTSAETEIPFNHVRRMDQRQCSNQQGDNLQPGFHFASSQKSVSSSQVQTSSSFHQEGKSPAEPARLEQAAAKETGSSGEPLNNNTGTDNTPNAKRKRNVNKAKEFDWDSLRRKVLSESGKKERGPENMDTLDYEALRHADVRVISSTILKRGMNKMLAERIKDFLNRLVRDHGSTDLEWLREVPPEQAKDYLLSIRGLGLKSVECVRLLTLHQVAFPVDTNVGRIAVRLGWVPLQPLPESLQLHLLELYPILESIQKYLWPRLCNLDQRTLYELHYQLITFGKVFCTKKKPNCNACPMRPECRHFASAFASARLALPAPEEKGMVNSTAPMATSDIPSSFVEPMLLLPACINTMGSELQFSGGASEPIIEEPSSPEPASPEPSPEILESDIEDLFYEDPDDYIPTINLNFEEFKTNVENVMRGQNMGIQLGDLSKALVALDASTASIPVPKLKNVSRLRTEHLVYELPDSHPLLKEMERREPDDPSPYLLAIWGPGETGDSTHPPEGCSRVHENENNSVTVRGTLLIPCRTAMRGSFPLNGTYFQVNEMFADAESSKNPIYVPREWLWKLPRRTVYFGTSVTSIFRGLTQKGIQFCFWRGFVCVRGFDRNQRTPTPLERRLHEIESRVTKNKDSKEQNNKANKEENNRANKERENKEKKGQKNKGKKERKKGKDEESNRVK